LRSDSHPALARHGRGVGYRYPHDDPAGFTVDCLPERLKGRIYFTPSGNGEEVERARDGGGERRDPGDARPDQPQTTG
jgi:putative ATPase